MQTRGAPLIGAVAAYGMALAANEDDSDDNLARAYDDAARDAADRDQSEMGAGRDDDGALRPLPRGSRVAAAYQARGGDLRRGCRDQSRRSAAMACR